MGKQMTQSLIIATTAAATVAVTPQIPQLARFGGVAKVGAGAAGYYLSRGLKGTPGALAMGASVGLAVDGAFDLLLPQGN